MRRIALVLTIVALIPSSAIGQEPATDLSQYYGFDQLEIFKLGRRSVNMLAGDLNHDGRTDLVLVDNSHSRIDLLLQRAEKPKEAAKPFGDTAVNFVGSDWRFEHKKLPVDKQIHSLKLGDFNSDGRTDIVYFGNPDRVIIRYQSKSGDWNTRVSFRVPGVPSARNKMATGDLNQDGKDDIVILAKNKTYIVYQQNDGRMAGPQSLMNTSDKLTNVEIVDLDGDGRNDLCYIASDNQDRYLCSHLGGEGGHLGPEICFDLTRPRSVLLANVDGKPGSEILTIHAQSGRVKILQLKRPEPKPDELAAHLIQYGFGRSGTDRERDIATGDMDGDGLTDVVVSDPEAAQMILFRQHGKNGLDLGTTYPGLLGASDIRIADFDGDKLDELVVLSVREKTLGICRLENNRLTFPKSLRIKNEPLTVELADLNGNGFPEIIYISRERAGRRSNYSMHALTRDATGTWTPFAFGDQKAVSIKTESAPKRLLKFDANRDGRTDFLVFSDRDLLLLKTNEQGVPEEVKTQGGISFSNTNAGSVFVGKLEKPVLLAAQKNFARNLQLESDNRWSVIDQYNAAEASARIAGVATLDFDGMPGNEIVLVDTGIRKLRVLRSEKNIFRPWREIEIGNFPYKSTHVADLNNDGKEDLLVFGRGKFAVIYAGQADPILQEVAAFETKLEKVFFAGMIADDLNGDSRTNLALIDTRTHYV